MLQNTHTHTPIGSTPAATTRHASTPLAHPLRPPHRFTPPIHQSNSPSPARPPTRSCMHCTPNDQVLDPASLLTVRKIENTDVKRLKVEVTECGEL